MFERVKVIRDAAATLIRFGGKPDTTKRPLATLYDGIPPEDIPRGCHGCGHMFFASRQGPLCCGPHGAKHRGGPVGVYDTCAERVAPSDALLEGQWERRLAALRER